MLHQVGVSFDLYYDARKHKIKIQAPSLDLCMHLSHPCLLYVASISAAWWLVSIPQNKACEFTISFSFLQHSLT